MAESFAPDLDLFEGGFALPDDLGEQVLEFMGEVPNYQDMSIPVNEQYLASWQAANQVTSANNNTPLSNEQLQQIKTFAALQPKYVPVVPGEGDRYNKRMEQAKQTPGAIYSNFETYATAMQEHNDQVQQYIEQENIPTSVTNEDGVELKLNLGITPAYYNEENAGGKLTQELKTGATGDYYNQIGEVGQYGTYYVKEKKTDWRDSLEASIPFVAAFIGASVIAPAISAGLKAAEGLSVAQKISYATKEVGIALKAAAKGTYSTVTAATNAINSAATTALGTVIPSFAESGATFNLTGSIAAILTGKSVADQYLDKESAAILEELGAAATSGGITYSGPGAGPDGSFDPSVIYNIAATADAQAEEDTSEQDAIDIAAAATAAVDALTNPEDTQEVIAANDAVTAAETATQAASDNVSTVIEETNASVASAEGYANYMRNRYGPFSSNYKRAKAAEDAAKLDARNKVNQARTAESVAQANYEDAIKLQQGTYKDAQDAYRVAQVEARRTAEADVQQRIAEQKEQNRIQRTTDTDGDGVYDVVDLFPNDPTEWADSDGDGVGDIAQQKALDEALLTTIPDYPEFDDLPVVVPVEQVPPPEDPPLDIAEPVVEQPVEDPTTGGGGDEGTPAEPVVAQPTDVGEEQPTSTDIIAAQLREAIDAEEDPNVKEGLQLELDKWLSGGPTEYQTVPSGPPPPDVTGDFDVTDAVSWVARLTDYFKEQPASDLDIEPTDPLADDFPEVPLTGGPVAFDPVEPIEPVEPVEEPVEPVEDPTGGAAETGVGAGDTGTGGGEGTGEGTGTGAGVGAGLGAGLTLGLASGMLKPQAVTDTLFKDIPFKRNYQAPEIIGAIEDLPTYKAPQVGLFQGII